MIGGSMGPDMIWALCGIILIFIEFFIPGLVIIFFGAGALVTALMKYLIGSAFSLPLQLLTFMTSSVLFLILLRRYMKKIFRGKLDSEGESENFNIEIGKVVPVMEYIQPGEVGGKVRYQGTVWNARSDTPAAPGESVRIIGSRNLTLFVEKTNKEEK
jgi:membrane protein implicated in regulation of membrane protease activity